MKHDMKIWLQELKKHTANCRATRPISRENALSWLQLLQMHIIKGSLLSWLNNLPSSISPGSAEQSADEVCVVFTSNEPGLVAAHEIILKQKLLLVFSLPGGIEHFFAILSLQ